MSDLYERVQVPVIPLRLGVLVHGATAPGHLSPLLDALMRRREVLLSVLILRPPVSVPAAERLAGAVLAAERSALHALGRRITAVSQRVGKKGVTQEARSRFAKVEVVPPGGPPPTLPKLDLLLVFGPVLPAGLVDDIRIDAAEIIHFEFGSPASPSLQLAGFAESFYGLDETSIALRRGDGVLVRGSNRTKMLFHLNQAALWNRGASLLLSYLDQQSSAGHSPPVHGHEKTKTTHRSSGFAEDLQETGPVTPNSSWLLAAQLLAYPARVCARLSRLAARQLTGNRAWSIAIHRLTGTGQPFGEKRPVEAAPKGTYWADPILYRCPESGDNFCFVEEMDAAAGRAHIAVLQEGGNGWYRRGTVLKETHHLSFPFLFVYLGTLYMCPESGGSGTIAVYRCVEFPMRWQKCEPLMTHVSAADTMIFEREGRWWMLTNLDRAEQPDHQSELHLFHADDPLGNQWIPVPGNPVKLGPRGARNGGLNSSDGKLFRFGQLQGFYAYGQGLAMYEITRIDRNGYCEKLVQQIEPPPHSNAVGMHTYSTAGDLVAVDLRGARQLVQTSM